MKAEEGMLARAAAYGAGEGRIAAQTWAVHMHGGTATADDRPVPNLSWEDWGSGRYATLPRGMLLRCVESDALDFSWEGRPARADAIAAAYDEAFRSAVEAFIREEGVQV